MTDAHSLVGAPLSDQERRLADSLAATAAGLVKQDPTGKRFNDFKDGLAYQGLLMRPGVAERLHPFLVQFATLPKPESRTARRARFALAIEERMAVNGCFTEDDAERLGMTGAEIRELKVEAFRCSGAWRMAA